MALTPKEIKERQIQSGKDVWKDKDTTERSEITTKMARSKWSKVSKEERSEHARKMALARWKKISTG